MEGLVKRFGDFTALDGVDLTVPQATVVGLLGPNGAGKTTTINILTTLLRPDGGRALVAGHDVVQEAQLVRAMIGLTGQYAAVDEDLTGRENLVLVGRLSRLPKKRSQERAAQLLDAFSLTAAGDRTLKTYSGGMRRRLDLAGSLMVSPPVLFLDEPTTGLDPRSRLELWDVITELRDQGTTIVLTTQYLEEADQLAQSISVIDGGKIIAEGTADQLKANVGGNVLEITVADRDELPAATKVLAVTFDLDQEDLTVNRDLARISLPLATGGAGPTDAFARAGRCPAPHRGLHGAPAVARRRLPQPHRPRRQGGRHHRRPTRQDPGPVRSSGGGPMSNTARAADLPLANTAIPVETATGTPEERAAMPVSRALADIGLVAQRNLRKMLRNPRLIVFTTIQPFMQLILFIFVFGAIADLGGGLDYKDFVVPAVLVQTMTFASMSSGVGIANDIHTGMVDRLRALPIARSAFLVGRTVSDSTRLSIQAVLLVIAATAVGFRFHNGALGALGMVVVVVLFGVALTAFSGWVGLVVGDPESVQAAVFIPILPLVFTSSAFAPVSRLPGWMQPFAKVSPVTAAIDTARGLALGDKTLFRVSNTHLGVSGLHFVLWFLFIMVLFTSLAVRRYRLGSG